MDNLAVKKYVLPKKSSFEEYIKQHKSTLRAGCKISKVKNWKTCMVFSKRVPTQNNGLDTFRFHTCGGKKYGYHSFSDV